MDWHRPVSSEGSAGIHGAEEGRPRAVKHGKALTRANFVDEVRKALSKAGMASHHISGLSFRIEAATAAARERATDTEIKAFGWWRSREYQGYIRRDSDMQASMAGRLVGGPRAGSSKGQNL